MFQGIPGSSLIPSFPHPLSLQSSGSESGSPGNPWSRCSSHGETHPCLAALNIHDVFSLLGFPLFKLVLQTWTLLLYQKGCTNAHRSMRPLLHFYFGCWLFRAFSVCEFLEMSRIGLFCFRQENVRNTEQDGALLVFHLLCRRFHCVSTTEEKLTKVQTSVIKIQPKLYVEHEASWFQKKAILTLIMMQNVRFEIMYSICKVVSSTLTLNHHLKSWKVGFFLFWQVWTVNHLISFACQSDDFTVFKSAIQI